MSCAGVLQVEVILNVNYKDVARYGSPAAPPSPKVLAYIILERYFFTLARVLITSVHRPFAYLVKYCSRRMTAL